MKGAESRWKKSAVYDEFATALLIVTGLSPLILPRGILVATSTMGFLVICLLVKGRPKTGMLALIWRAVLVVSGAAATALAATSAIAARNVPFTELGSSGAAFYFALTGVLLFAHRQTRDAGKANATSPLLLYDSQCALFLACKDEFLPNVDVQAWDPGFANSRCYLAKEDVVAMTFKDWDPRISAAVAESLEFRRYGAAIRWTAEAQCAVDKLVDYHTGTLLVYDSQLVLVSRLHRMTVPIAKLSGIFWNDDLLILSLADAARPLMFKIPAPEPPWLFAAAAARAVRDLTVTAARRS
jgi:hypothetical protein